MDEPHSRYLADTYLHRVQDVASRLDKASPDQYKDAVKTMRDNITVVIES